MHLKHATFVAQEPKRTRPRSRSRLRKTKKKWIDGSRLQDQDSRKQDPRSNHYTDAQVGDAEGLFKSLKWIDGSRLKKARPKKQSLYRCPGWGHRRSLQVAMDHNTTTTCVCHYNLC